MRILVVFSMIVFLSSALLAQRKSVPSPPKPHDEGPSLEETMKFIQKRLNEEGQVSFVTTPTGVTGNTLRGWWHSYETLEASADAATCKLSYTTSTSLDFDSGPSPTGSRVASSFFFNEVRKIEVMSATDWYKRDTPGSTDSFSINPEVYYLVPHMSEGKQVLHRGVEEADNKAKASSKTMAFFAFHEEEMANRMAKAMVHAVELCGGGKEKEEKEPF